MTEQTTTPKDKWELQITDTLKIQQFDDKNFMILQLKEGYNPRTKETTTSYKEQGYYQTVYRTLDAILTKDLMVDINAVKDLKYYMCEVRKAKAYIRDLMEGKRRSYNE